MKLTNKTKNVELIISTTLLEKIGEEAKAHYPNEFGGFLLGTYSKDFHQLFVLEFMLPNEFKSFNFFFERSIKNLEEMFESQFINNNIYYVGEWHSHPDCSSNYSLIDLKAMKQIAEKNTVKIKNPILLIVSITKYNVLETSLYLYDKGGLTPYE